MLANLMTPALVVFLLGCVQVFDAVGDGKGVLSCTLLGLATMERRRLAGADEIRRLVRKPEAR
ncbi:hypothetical protein [Lentzea sp. HUAS12]|uniref:hypothetical protein n=1 Tax=Lentzea sp. HUAS12 TaxID=2951806 RepID=UPI0020A0B99F|nr:hypothetical protein [Lentzea sp. HUAS12]USX56335.1 hypothetical protein ND450_20210 [Lentzea sp. HUAS12]